VNLAILAAQWQGDPAMMVGIAEPTGPRILATTGDVTARRPWASVSKVAVGLAAMISVEGERGSLEDGHGPEGATVAHLLSHASGLGFEASERAIGVGVRRVYSNVGIDLAAAYFAPDDPIEWVRDTALTPLGFSGAYRDRVCAGIEGSAQEMVALANELLVPRLMSAASQRRMLEPFLPELSGITPPFGRQTPNWWGMGPELKGGKEHWMGHWPSASFGHFGRSGAMLLCDPTTNLFIVATSTEPFGPWALDLWPTWIDRVRTMVLA